MLAAYGYLFLAVPFQLAFLPAPPRWTQVDAEAAWDALRCHYAVDALLWLELLRRASAHLAVLSLVSPQGVTPQGVTCGSAGVGVPDAIARASSKEAAELRRRLQVGRHM